MPIGPLELAIVLLILIVIFGPKRLPGLGKSLGQGMREFKDSVTGGKSDGDERADGEPGDGRRELPAAAEEDVVPRERDREPATVASDPAGREQDHTTRGA